MNQFNLSKSTQIIFKIQRFCELEYFSFRGWSFRLNRQKNLLLLWYGFEANWKLIWIYFFSKFEEKLLLFHLKLKDLENIYQFTSFSEISSWRLRYGVSGWSFTKKKSISFAKISYWNKKKLISMFTKVVAGLI